MLSDSSVSDVNIPVKSRGRLKNQLVSSSDDDNFDERPVKRVKVTRCFRVSNSDDNNDNDSPVKPSKSGSLRVQISSDSSDSDIPGPSRKNKCTLLFAKNCQISNLALVRFLIISESESDNSDDSDSDEVLRPWHPKEITGKKKRVIDDSDFSESDGDQPSSTPGQAKVEEGLSSDSDGAERCIICFKTLGTPFANPSNCNHSFHEECLSTWSKTSNTCPIDRVKYTAIYIRGTDGNLVTKRNVTTPPPQDHNADLEPDDPTFCEICNQHDRESEMLLCDRCEAGYHMDCLTPPLSEVPSGDWFCPDCSTLGNTIGEDEVRDLLAGTIVLETRFRTRQTRTPRVQPRTRAAQRVLNTIRHRANLEEPQSTTAARSRTTTERKKKSKRKRRTRYKVALVTADDGTTVEVKVAIKSGKHRRRKRKSCGRGIRKQKGRASVGGESSSADHHHHRTSLDIFGTRPQLDYFSGCEAEDELEEDGGLVALRRARPTVRGMAERKQIAAQIFASHPRRPLPSVDYAPPAVDVLSSILQDQEKTYTSNSANDNKRY